MSNTELLINLTTGKRRNLAWFRSNQSRPRRDGPRSTMGSPYLYVVKHTADDSLARHTPVGLRVMVVELGVPQTHARRRPGDLI